MGSCKFKWDNSRIFEGDVIRKLASHVALQNRVRLESVILVALGGHAHGMTDDAITGLETRDIWANRMHHTGDVLAKDGWVVHGPPGLGLQAAIDGVDGDGGVLDEDFVLRRFPEGLP